MNKKRLVIISIIIICVTILVSILGIYLIFACAKVYGVDEISDEKLRSQLDNLFTDRNERIRLYPNTYPIKFEKGSERAIILGIKNLEINETSYEYKLSVAENQDLDLCGNNIDPNLFIKYGREGNVIVSPKNITYEEILFLIPKNINECDLRYTVVVTSNGTFYDMDSFFIKIERKENVLDKIKNRINSCF